MSRSKWAVAGRFARALKVLPAPVRDRLFESFANSAGGNPPPFADIVTFLEAAGGMPVPTRWQRSLLVDRPHLGTVSTRDLSIAPNGPRARLYTPPTSAPDTGKALVWIHGGAFVMGGLDQAEAHWPALELAARGVPVLSLDYRHCLNGVHYPAPHQDILLGWQWAMDHRDDLGGYSELHLGGASAGGCLAAGAALALRDRDEPPASLFLAYPVLQELLPAPTTEADAVLRALPTHEMSVGWLRDMHRHYTGGRPVDAYAEPGTAPLAGLPPTFVLSCGHDALRAASEPFAERIKAAGITTRHELLPSSEHAPYERPGTADGDTALKHLVSWILQEG